MKKSLFAIAAATAFTGAAQAQSSVTVYGILDVGYIGSSQRNPGSTNSNLGRTANGLGNSAETTSRLGFRGTEDLGGGMRSFFTVEIGLTPMLPGMSGTSTGIDGTQATSNGGGSVIDNRQSFVGLGQKGLGQVALGRQYTPVFNAGAATSVGQYNNVTGDVLYIGANGPNAAQATGLARNLQYTNRASNSITFQTDSFSGLRLAGMYALNATNTSMTSGTVGGNVNWSGWGLGADYTWNKLYVNAAYQSFKTNYTNQVTAADLTLAGVAGATATGGASLEGSLGACSAASVSATGLSSSVSCTAAALYAASQITDNQMIASASYDFGILKAFAGWTARKNTNNGAVVFERSAQQVGVRGYFTPKIEGWASAGNGTYKGAAGATQPQVAFTGYQLGSNYYLSKRTNLYAIFGFTQSANKVNATNATGAGYTATEYAIGVRHSF